MIEDTHVTPESQADQSAPTEELPDLPQEVWPVIARAALAARGSSYGAWLQLRSVSREWRHALEGTA